MILNDDDVAELPDLLPFVGRGRKGEGSSLTIGVREVVPEDDDDDATSVASFPLPLTLFRF